MGKDEWEALLLLIGGGAGGSILPKILSKIFGRRTTQADAPRFGLLGWIVGTAQLESVVSTANALRERVDELSQELIEEREKRRALEAIVDDLRTQLRRATSNRYREIEQRWRSVWEFSPSGKAIVGIDGTFLEVNPSFCQIARRQAYELVGMTFQEITHPDDLGKDIDYVRRCIEREIDHYEIQKRYLDKEGNAIPIKLVVSAIYDHEHSPPEFQYFLAQICQTPAGGVE